MKREAGFSFIEVVIALGILGLIAVGFMGGLAGASKGLIVADERETANNLAEAQIESVKNQQYIDYSKDLHDVYDKIDLSSYPTYTLSFTAVPFDPDTGQPYSQTDGIFEQDDGIQRITVTVKHDNNDVLSMVDYKVN